jgi:hypothetical protein
MGIETSPCLLRAALMLAGLALGMLFGLLLAS